MIENIEGAFVLIREEAEKRVKGTNNDIIAMLHTCFLEVSILIDKEMCEIREDERKLKMDNVRNQQPKPKEV